MAYTCPKCEESFQGRGKLGKHIQMKHGATKVKCDQCGKEFKCKPSHIKNHNFCSQECYGEWRSERKEMNIHNLPDTPEGKEHPNWKEYPTVKCEYCGKKYKVKPSLAQTTRFCSKECIDKWERESDYCEKRVIKTCKECGKEFEVIPSSQRKFCSMECHANWKKGRSLSEDIKEKMKGPRPSLQGSNNPMWKGGVSFEPYPPEFNEELKEKIRKRDDRTCQMCGTTKNGGGRKMCVHHIDGNKENCSSNNLVTLCFSCNRKLEDLGVRPQFKGKI